MSNSLASPSTPRPSSRMRSTGTPPASSSGPATRRTRSASNRSLPAETGVWMVKTLSRRTAVQASSSDDLAGHVLAGTFGEQECRMALVQMPDRRREPQLADRPDAADAEDQLLVEAHLATADVQDVGDRPVGLGVLRQVRVEQEDGDAPDLGHPDRDVQVAPGQLDGHRQRQARRVLDPAERQAAQVVVGVVVLLVAVGIDRLAEIALAVEQPDADGRQGHVAGGLHVVAGEDPEAARIDPERLVEAVFGAEVGDRTLERLAVAALEPVAGAVGHVVVEVGQDVVVFGQEARVVEQARPVGRPADDRDRVPIARPRRSVDGAEQAARARMPRPVEVVGEASKAFEPGRERETRSRLRGDADGIHEAASYSVGKVVNRFSGALPRCPGRRRSERRVRCRGCRSCRCASRCSPPNASRGPRQAAWPMSSTPWRARSASWTAPRSRRRSTSSCRATAGCPSRRASSARSTLRVPDPRAPSGISTVTVLDVPANGYRLRLVDHPAAFDRDGFYGDDGRRLPGQRVAVRALLPRRRSRRCGPTGGRSTSSTSTIGTPARRRSSATSATRPIRSSAARRS